MDLLNLLVSDTYQSNGACEQTCADYALGVLQGKKCWCTNVAPSESSRKSTSDCSTGCPGYPDDSCGSASKGVFAYVKITGNSVTSTEGGSSLTTSTSSVSDPPLLSVNKLCRLELVALVVCLSCLGLGALLFH